MSGGSYLTRRNWNYAWLARQFNRSELCASVVLASVFVQVQSLCVGFTSRNLLWVSSSVWEWVRGVKAGQAPGDSRHACVSSGVTCCKCKQSDAKLTRRWSHTSWLLFFFQLKFTNLREIRMKSYIWLYSSSKDLNLVYFKLTKQ